MKIAKEYSLLFIIGMFILASLLDLAVKPLSPGLVTSPYLFFKSNLIYTFPFSTLSIAIKSIALFLTPLWLLSFSKNTGFGKPIILLIWSGLTQLYAVQDIVAKAKLIPVEWSLSLTASGFVLLIPTAIYFIKAALTSAHSNLTNAKMEEAIKQAQKKSQDSKKSD